MQIITKSVIKYHFLCLASKIFLSSGGVYIMVFHCFNFFFFADSSRTGIYVSPFISIFSTYRPFLRRACPTTHDFHRPAISRVCAYKTQYTWWVFFHPSLSLLLLFIIPLGHRKKIRQNIYTHTHTHRHETCVLAATQGRFAYLYFKCGSVLRTFFQ